MRKLSGALALLLAACPARAAEEGQEGRERPEVKLHWGLPRQVTPGWAGDLRYGAAPRGLAAVGGWLLVSCASHGNSQARVFGRGPEGPWLDLSGAGQANRLSRWAALADRAVLLAGGRGGVQATVIAPGAAPDKRVESFDVLLPEAGKGPAHVSRSYFDVYGLDLAVHGGALYALAALGTYAGGGRRCELLLVRSDDGGRSWSKPRAVIKSTGYFSRRGALALWSGGGKLHALYAPPSGGGSAELKHSASADGGRTWKDAPALPAPAAGRQLYAARAAGGGEGVRLLVTDTSNGGGVWLYRSADGGETWKAPLKIGAVKLAASSSGVPLEGCFLAGGKELLVFGHGGTVRSSVRDKLTGQTVYKYGGAGELLTSRDGGATWKKRDFTRGLAGHAFCPLAAPRPGGGLEAVFGWTDGKGSGMRLLARGASPRPPAGPDAALAAELARLIRDLAGEDYRVREKAAAGIAARGLAALPALREAARDPDPERSLWAEDLIRKLTPAWWKGP